MGRKIKELVFAFRKLRLEVSCKNSNQIDQWSELDRFDESNQADQINHHDRWNHSD